MRSIAAVQGQRGQRLGIEIADLFTVVMKVSA